MSPKDTSLRSVQRSLYVIATLAGLAALIHHQRPEGIALAAVSLAALIATYEG